MLLELSAPLFSMRAEKTVRESALAARCRTAAMNPRLTAALKSFGVTERVVENRVRSRLHNAQGSELR